MPDRRRFHVFDIVDDVRRECIRAVVATAIPVPQLVRELADLIGERSKPKRIAGDNATHQASTALLPQFENARIEWNYATLGKSKQRVRREPDDLAERPVVRNSVRRARQQNHG